MKSIYCPSCDKTVDTEVSQTMDTLRVRNVDVVACQLHATCPVCGEEIADGDITKRNLDSAFDAYRAKEELLTPDEIRSAYEKYGLTQRSFAALLGLGGATLSRYEHGALQTRQIDASIRQASKPENMLDLLRQHGELIPQDQLDIARSIAMKSITQGLSEDNTSVTRIGNVLLVPSEEAPSIKNGFRRLDLQKVAQMAIFMAEHCRELGRTKLNKALFYSDFSCFAETACSMSGLAYARAPQGPIVDQYDAVFGELVREGHLSEEATTCGPYEVTVYKANEKFDSTLFSAQELDILERVACFINKFASAKALSDYSHGEKLWIENDNGAILSYMDAYALKDLDSYLAE